MNYPLISEYIEAVKAAEDNFKELTYLRPVLDNDAQPVMTSGNFAVVFKMQDKETDKFYALKCFTKGQEGRDEAYHQIADALKDVESPYLVSLRYLDKELFVDTKQTTETEFPVLLMDWVEGKTLDKYLRENLDDKYALEMLAYRFSQLAQWLIPQPFAHGDLKPDNIIVRDDGTLVLVDYDGMYVPAMKGQKARELGSPDFRHPLRTENDFDEHIDDFPLISILLSLKSISIKPQLLDDFGATDRLLFSEHDYCSIIQIQLLKEIFPSTDSELNILVNLFMLTIEEKNLSSVSSSLLELSRPENLNTTVTVEDYINAWTDEYGVIYSNNGKRLIKGADVINYSIREGTEIICDNSFENCNKLTQIVIPQSVNKIGSCVFAHCSQLKSAVLPEGIVYLDWYTFAECTNLEKIYLPSSLQSLWGDAFAGCSNLVEINLPENIIFIGQGCFNDCSRLKSISLPDNISCIENDTFGGCRNLQYVKLPIHLKEIDDRAFSDCVSLKKIEIPISVSSIGYFPFTGCKELVSIIIPKGTKGKFETMLPEVKDKLIERNDDDSSYIKVFNGNCNVPFNKLSTLATIDEIEHGIIDKDGILYSKDGRKLLRSDDYCGGTPSKYYVHEGTQIICDNAFTDTKTGVHPTTLIIPSSLLAIGKDAFESIFTPNVTELLVPNGSLNRFKQMTPQYCHLVYEISLSTTYTDEEIKEGMIDEQEVVYCKDHLKLLRCNNRRFLRKYKVRDNVKAICCGAFQAEMIGIDDEFYPIYESALSEIKLPNTLQRIGSDAFRGCYCLKSIIIPNSVINIGSGAFWGAGIEEITIPSSVQYIEDFAFGLCTSMKTICFKGTPHCGSDIFIEAYSLNRIIIPNGTKDYYIAMFPEYDEILNEEI